MPTFCNRDDGWPKKRCYIHKGKEPYCRYWNKNLPQTGCGINMWQVVAKNGMLNLCAQTDNGGSK